jgi:ATP-dependent RNA helicase DeaD
MMEGGVNCLFPFEVNGCAHPAELLNEYGKDLRIMGGFDKIELARGPPPSKPTWKTLVPLVERGGFIPFCDHRCPPNVKPEYYLYYLDLKEQMFGMITHHAGSSTVTKTFDDFGLAPAVRRAVTDLGFEKPTPVQSRVIPVLMAGERDMVALAQTGTGKTAAYGLPLVQRTNPDERTPQTLILCPTRELCMQITRDLTNFAQHIPALRILAVYGGAPIVPQMMALSRGVHIVVATPGRMHDMVRRKRAWLAGVRQVVLDEADEMMSMGFQEDLEAILKEVPGGVRTLLFSATMPTAVAAIARKFMQNPEEITIGVRDSGSETVNHEYYMVHARDRYAALKRIIDFYPNVYGIVFCRTRAETQDVAGKLMGDGYDADALHGDLSQPQRDQVMEKFRLRHLQLLVATDVAARGLDVTDLTHVINYGLPEDVNQYTHRSGRTGRAGKPGISVVIINLREEHKIAFLARAVKRQFQHKRLPSGREVCAAQLHGLLDRARRVKVDEEQLAEYLPQIREILADLPAEEVVKRLALLELNRFLAYYKSAPDLNTEVERGRRESGPRPMPGPALPANATRCIVNLGRRNGLRPADLMGLINRAAPGRRIEVGRIEVENDRTVFDVVGGDMRMLAAMNAQDFQGRRVFVRVLDRASAEAPDPRRAHPAAVARESARPERPAPHRAPAVAPPPREHREHRRAEGATPASAPRKHQLRRDRQAAGVAPAPATGPRAYGELLMRRAKNKAAKRHGKNRT